MTVSVPSWRLPSCLHCLHVFIACFSNRIDVMHRAAGAKQY